jgi:hypothetical protein
MTGKTTASPAEIAVAVLLAAGLALGGALGLRAIAKPPHFDGRLASISADAVQAKDLLARRDERQPQFDAVCPRPTVAAAEKLRGDLAALAAGSHLEAAQIEVRPEFDAVAAGRLQPLDVRFQASGPYEAAVTALGAVAALRPALFLETVDLQAKVSVVALSFKGRVYCSALH